MGVSLETKSNDGVHYSLIDAEIEGWSTHYGPLGGGFGYLKFNLQRPIGHSYPEIGYGYEVIIRKYLVKILFHGTIRQIEEVKSDLGSTLNVVALGQAVVLEEDELIEYFCDTDLARWITPNETPVGLYRPDNFTTGYTDDSLYIHVNNGSSTASANSFTELSYEMFGDSTVKRFKATMSMDNGKGVGIDDKIKSINLGLNSIENWYGFDPFTVGFNLVNSTRNQERTIITRISNEEVIVEGDITEWEVEDKLLIFGPVFSATVTNIFNDLVYYDSALGQPSSGVLYNILTNITRKETANIVATIGQTQIKVSDSDSIANWVVGDLIMSSAYLAHTFTTGYDFPQKKIELNMPVIGEDFVSSSPGWVIKNLNKTTNNLATVESWNIDEGYLIVTDSSDISSWNISDYIAFFSPYKAEILDEDNNLIWPDGDWRIGAIPQSGTDIDVLVGNKNQLRLILKSYIGGSGDESSFVSFRNPRIYSTTSETTASMLANYIIGILERHGLSNNTKYVEVIDKKIEPMVFEYETLKDALVYVTQFGDNIGDPISWGIRLNDKSEFYLEKHDKSTVKYIVTRMSGNDISFSGDLQNSWQKIRGTYTDVLGDQTVTDWITDEDFYFNEGHRAQTIPLSVSNKDSAEELVGIFLNENKKPKVASSLLIKNGSIRNPNGIVIPFDEVQATGGLVRIDDFRSREASEENVSSLRNDWTTELLVAVEVNYKQKTVTLVPGSAKTTFESYMAELTKIAGDT